MWINFLLTVAIMAVVLGRFMATVKRQRRALAEVRERALRDESVLALGTLAAGTFNQLMPRIGASPTATSSSCRGAVCPSKTGCIVFVV